MREIRLDLVKEAFNTRGFITRKGEYGEKIQVTLYNNGVKVDLTKETPEITLKGLNSRGEYTESPVSIEGGIATLILEQDWNAVSGTFETAYFEVVGTISGVDSQLSTVDVDWYVLPEADISEGQRASYIKKLEEVLKELEGKADTFLEELSENLVESKEHLNDLKTQLANLQVDIDSVLEELHAADFYTKEEADTRFALKGSGSDSYSKEESDARFALGTDVVHLTGDETISGKKTFEEKISLSSDIPETPLTFLDGFEAYPNQEPVYSKENGRVYLEGAVRTTKEIPAGSTGMFALPAGCRPSVTKDQICPGSNTTLWTLSAESGGMVKVSNYRTTYPAAPSSNIPLGTRLPISMSFKIAD